MDKLVLAYLDYQLHAGVDHLLCVLDDSQGSQAFPLFEMEIMDTYCNHSFVIFFFFIQLFFKAHSHLEFQAVHNEVWANETFI